MGGTELIAVFLCGDLISSYLESQRDDCDNLVAKNIGAWLHVLLGPSPRDALPRDPGWHVQKPQGFFAEMQLAAWCSKAARALVLLIFEKSDIFRGIGEALQAGFEDGRIGNLM